ncbi:MAG: sigma-70 family RNA polymerase sigma factor [Desulfobulbaceae bacterium]|nr:sigma-70 family RNA polymerase sigma factor [Desulfobulbaceae bacterium]
MLTIQAKDITDHWPLINRLAGRRFVDTNLAEEAALFVLNKLRDNNCRRLRGFRGRSKVSTFISSVTVRLLEDFSRHKFGRGRPPQWISDLGGIWVTLFQFLCLQRLNLTDAVEAMKSRVAGTKKEQVEEKALTILELVVNCGQHQRLEVSFNDTGEDQLNDQDELTGHHSTPEETLLKNERTVLFDLLFKEQVEGRNCTAAAHSFTSLLQQPIRLSAQERILLKLRFQDEISVSRIGRMLKMNSNQIHGKMRRLLKRLRYDLDRAGISDELREMLYEV